MSFESIPELQHQSLKVSRIDVVDSSFSVDLQKYANTLIYRNFPLVASLTLQAIDEELEQSLEMKENTLRKLKKKYNKKSRNVNVVYDIIIDDFEMAIEGNVKLIPDAHANLMRTTNENNLIQVIIKQFEQNQEGKPIEKEFLNIYTFLRNACKYKFTNLVFADDNQENLDEYMVARIVQVWQIFQQYFRQFDYPDYLDNYYTIKRSTDTKFILSILRILVEIGTINC
ncbi:hypothetical protein [Drosophila suzukii associated hytrosavirus 1]|nr:hypothetical protein [Drosophila suzukii associated hytrosavirus 1]